jgi:hypothetical protein
MEAGFGKARDRQSGRIFSAEYLQSQKQCERNAPAEQLRMSGDVTQTFLRARIAHVTLVQRCMRPFRSFFS